MKHFISLLFVAAIASVQSAAQEPVCPEFITIGPFQQTSTASREVLKNSTIDARCFSKVDYVVQILGSTPVPGTSNVFVSLFGTNDIFDGNEQQSGSPKGAREEYQVLSAPGGTHIDIWCFDHAPATMATYWITIEIDPGSEPQVVTFSAIAKK